MTRTTARNGVLIFLAWRDHRFAIIGDTGIHAQMGDSFWQETTKAMSPSFATGDLVAGVVAGVRAAGEALLHHFPHQRDDTNELANAIPGGRLAFSGGGFSGGGGSFSGGGASGRW